MFSLPAYSLALHNEHHAKGWLLEIVTECSEAGERLAQDFQDDVFVNMDRATHWFLQGSDRNWKLVEFWSDDQDLILSASLSTADRLGLDLYLGHARDPRLMLLLARAA